MGHSHSLSLLFNYAGYLIVNGIILCPWWENVMFYFVENYKYTVWNGIRKNNCTSISSMGVSNSWTFIYMHMVFFPLHHIFRTFWWSDNANVGYCPVILQSMAAMRSCAMLLCIACLQIRRCHSYISQLLHNCIAQCWYQLWRRGRWVEWERNWLYM